MLMRPTSRPLDRTEKQTRRCRLCAWELLLRTLGLRLGSVARKLFQFGQLRFDLTRIRRVGREGQIITQLLGCSGVVLLLIENRPEHTVRFWPAVRRVERLRLSGAGFGRI